MPAKRLIQPQTRDGDRELLKVEIFAVAAPVTGESGIEVHVGEPEAADDPAADRAQERALVRQAEAGEVRVGVKVARFELLAVVHDGLPGCAIAAQEGIKLAGTYGVTRGEVEGHTALENFGDVNPSRTQAQPRARLTARGAAGGREFPYLEPADRCADPAIERELPALLRALLLGRSFAGRLITPGAAGLSPPGRQHHQRRQGHRDAKRDSEPRHGRSSAFRRFPGPAGWRPAAAKLTLASARLWQRPPRGVDQLDGTGLPG